jgi:hypothetical protein
VLSGEATNTNYADAVLLIDVKQVYSSTCSTKELSISMTAILHAVKGELLSYCDKVYSRGNINQKHTIFFIYRNIQ